MKRLWKGIFLFAFTLFLFACKKKENDTKTKTTENTTHYNETYHDVVFVNYDQAILYQTRIKDGETPTYTMDTPTRPSDGNYTYTFTGWSPQLGPVHDYTVYVAQYSTSSMPYSIVFDLNSGTSTDDIPAVVKTDKLSKDLFSFNVKRAGYVFKGWSYEGNIVFDAKGNLVSTPYMKANMVFKAEFTDKVTLKINYTLSNPKTGEVIERYETQPTGIGNISKTADYSMNSNVDLYAQLVSGYTFIGWFVDGIPVSPLPNYMLVIGEQDMEIEAKFQYTPYRLTVKSGNSSLGKVMIKKDDSQTFYNVQIEDEYFTEGVTIVAYTDTDARFLGWYNATTGLVASNAMYAFAMPNNDYELEARWDSFTITYALNGGTNNPNNPSTYTSTMDNITLYEPTRSGYTFAGWYYEGNLITEINTANCCNMTLEARWSYYTLTTTRNINQAGSVSTYSNTNVTANTTVELLATTNKGYTFIGWFEGNEKISDDASFNYTMPKRNVTLEARWSINSYELTLECNSACGTLTGDGIYQYTSSVTVNATVNEGYVFDGWYNGTSKVSSDLTYTFTMPNINLTLEAKYTYDSYTLTLNKNISEAGLAIGGGTKNYMSEVTITATVNDGYSFIGWYQGENEVSSELSYTFIMPNNNTSYEAKWAINSYTVTTNMNYDDAGSVSGANTYKYLSDVTVKATTTNDGYTFIGWFNGEAKVSEESTYTFIMPYNNLTLEARWTLNVYAVTLTYNNQNAGVVKGAGNKTYKSEVTISVTTNTGYTFIGWFNGETMISSDESYTFNMPKENLSYEARWSTNSYELTLIKNIDEAGTVAGAGSHVYGSEVTISATTNNGYTFVGWFEGTSKVATSSEYTFLMRNSNFELEARWSINTYQVILSRENVDAGTISGAGTKAYKAEVTISATTNSGYTFVGWFSEDSLISSSATYTFNMPSNGVSYVAKWSINSYALTVTKNIEDAGTVTGSGTYEYNSGVTISATVNPGYAFLGWFDGETRVSPLPTYTFGMPSSDKTYLAKFSLEGYDVIISKNIDDAGTVYGSGTYEYNSDVTISEQASEGYTFIGWYKGDTEVSSSSTYTFTMPHYSVTITAKYSRKTYSLALTKNIDLAGTISGSGSYEYGEEVTINATENEGYSFNGWYNGSSLISTYKEYTFTMPHYTISYEAVYSLKEHDVILINDDSNYGSIEGEGTYQYSSTVQVKATPIYGYEFVGWFNGETKVSEYKTYQFTMPNADVTLTAKWIIGTYTLTLNKNADDGGTVSGAGTYTFNEVVTISVEDSGLYTFGGWYKGNTLVSTSTEYSFRMPGENIVYTAKWFVYFVNVTITGGVGATTPSRKTMFEIGETVEMSATPYAGYNWVGWYQDNELVESSQNYSFTMPEDDVYFEARFEVKEEMANYAFESNPDYCIIRYIIDETVEEIVFPDYVWYLNTDLSSCTNLRRFVSGNGLVNGNVSFRGNTNLEEVIIGNNYESTISDNCFYGCTNLKTVVLGKKVQLSLNSNTFSSCKKLESITILNKNINVNGAPFQEFTSLQTISLPFYQSSYNSGGNYVFATLFGTSAYTGGVQVRTYYYNQRYYLPETLNDLIITGATQISNYEFDNCVMIQNITIPSDVIRIENYAFSGCTSLENVYYDGTINQWFGISFANETSNPLYYASNLYVLDENGSVEHNGKYYSLVEDLVIPDGATAIEALESLPNLAGSLESIVIPNSVTSVVSNAFSKCTNLNNVYYNGTIEDWCSITFGTATSNPMCYATNFYILDENGSVEYNGKHYTLLTELIIPNSITTIGKYQFYGFGLLTSVEIPNTVIKSDKYAFSGCDGLTAVYYDGTIEDWCNITFVVVSSTIVESNPVYYTSNFYLLDDEGNVSYNDNDYILLRELEIPDTVTSIKQNQFFGMKNLNSVTLSRNVTIINNYAFYNCVNLETVYYDGTMEDWCNITFKGETSNPMYYASHFCILDEEGNIEHNEKNYNLLTELVIPEVITNIGAYQFCGFGDFTNVLVPDSVISIGRGAFRKCSSIVKITLPFVGNDRTDNSSSSTYTDHVDDVFGHIFGYTTTTTSTSVSGTTMQYSYRASSSTITYCRYYIPTSLKEVIITDMESIPMNAFYNCTMVKSVSISNAVTTINNSAFYNCSMLEDISISNLLELVEGSAFYNCGDLVNVFYGGTIEDWCNIEFTPEMVINKYYLQSNPLYYSSNLCLYDEDGNIEHNNKNYTVLTELVVPDSINEIGPCQFAGYKKLTRVTIHSGVTKIGFGAFTYCENIQYVDIENGLSSIGQYAFYGCNKLINITIPNSVNIIDYYAFYGCSSLEKIVLPYVGRTRESGNYEAVFGYIFGYTTTTTSTAVEGTTMQFTTSTTSSGSTTTTYFRYYIPASLKEVIITDMEKIPARAFCACSMIENITLPNNLSTIGSSAFINCNLINLYYDCDLNSIYSINCANSEANPILWALNVYYYDELGDIEYNGKNYSIFDQSIIPDGVSKIEQGQFNGNQALNYIELPSSITSIGNNTFNGCSNLIDVYYNGTIEDWCNISFGNITSNPMYFASNFFILDENGDVEHNEKSYSLLEKVALSSLISNINRYSFYGFDNLQAVYYDGTIEDWCNISFENETSNPMYNAISFYIFDEYGDYEYNGKNYSLVNELIIPESITNIGNYQFYGFNNLTEIIIPNTVVSIGTFAFYGSSSLEKITIPFVGNDRDDKSSSTTYSDHIYDVFGYIFGYKTTTTSTAVAGTTMQYSYRASSSSSTITYCRYYIPTTIKEVVITDCESIPAFAFYNCNMIQTISIPNAVMAINNSVFYNCTGLVDVYYDGANSDWLNITLGNDYSNPMYYASNFYYLDTNGNVEYNGKTYSLLEEIVIPNNTSSISSSRFYGFSCLKSVTIPSSVVSIGSSAFANTGLVSVKLPNSVSTIAASAFSGCTELESIILSKYCTTINNNAFGGCSSLESVYFYGSESDTSSITIGTGNDAFTNATMYYYSETEPEIGGNYWHYDENNEVVVWA